MNPALPVLPRRAVIAGGALLLASVAGIAALRRSGYEAREPDAATAASRALRFEDRPDGSIAVIDALTGAVIEQVQGEQGFLRGTLRGLARERRLRGLGPEQPFDLIGRSDGRLTLADPATGQRIDLESFGPTNAAIYARWLSGPKRSTP